MEEEAILRDIAQSIYDDAQRYRKLCRMHWTNGRLCVIRAKDVPLGVQTYTGKHLDEAVDAQPILPMEPRKP